MLCIASTLSKLEAQNSDRISPRYTKLALQNLDSLNGIPFLKPWDYQSHSAGFGKPGQNALPYVVKQAYRSFRFYAIPEPFQQGGMPRYGPQLSDGVWGVFAENGDAEGVIFGVSEMQLHGQYKAYFRGAVLRFLIPHFFYNDAIISHDQIYSIEGKFYNGMKVGNWKLITEKNKTLLKWSYDSTGKFQSEDSIFEKRHFKGLIRYQYVSQDHQAIIQGMAKEMYTVYKNDPRGKLIRKGAYLRYHPNGRIATEGNYTTGLKNGNWLYYNADGSVLKTEIWRNGKLVK